MIQRPDPSRGSLYGVAWAWLGLTVLAYLADEP